MQNSKLQNIKANISETEKAELLISEPKIGIRYKAVALALISIKNIRNVTIIFVQIIKMPQVESFLSANSFAIPVGDLKKLVNFEKMNLNFSKTAFALPASKVALVSEELLFAFSLVADCELLF